MLLGFIAFLEVGASLYYYYGVAPNQRTQIEQVLLLEDPDGADMLRYAPHPYFNYVCNPQFRYPDGYVPHNSRGFREPEWPAAKAPDEFRILTVGGSTTYGAYAKKAEDVWPAMLEQQLQAHSIRPVKVLNLGVPSYTTHEIIGVLAMIAPSLAPDLIVIHVGANEAFSAAYPDEGGPDNTTFRFSWNYRPFPAWLLTAMQRSFTLRLAGYAWASRAGRLPGAMIQAFQSPVPPPDQLQINARQATGKYFRQTLNTIIGLTRQIGATPVLCTHPIHPGWNPSDAYYQSVRPAIERNNRIIQEIGATEQLPVVDWYGQITQSDRFADALHATLEGMETKAKLLADAIQPLMERQ